MSTSAKVIFTNKDCEDKMSLSDVDFGSGVYIHSDGSPKDIIDLLEAYLSFNGAKSRCDDVNYLTSYFTTFVILNKFKSLTDKDLTLNEMENLNDFLGVGVTVEDYIYTNYTYLVNYHNNRFHIYVYDVENELIDVYDFSLF